MHEDCIIQLKDSDGRKNTALTLKGHLAPPHCNACRRPPPGLCVLRGRPLPAPQLQALAGLHRHWSYQPAEPLSFCSLLLRYSYCLNIGSLLCSAGCSKHLTYIIATAHIQKGWAPARRPYMCPAAPNPKCNDACRQASEVYHVDYSSSGKQHIFTLRANKATELLGPSLAIIGDSGDMVLTTICKKMKRRCSGIALTCPNDKHTPLQRPASAACQSHH